jgi:hypothetical protein
MPKRALFPGVLATVIAMAGMSALLAGGAAASSTMIGRSGVTGGALFGGNMGVQKVDSQLGRKLAIVRRYFRIGNKYPWPADKALMSRGSTEMISLDTTRYSYSSIAAGHHDGSILPFLRSVNKAASSYHLSSIYVSFQHEASNANHRVLGSPAEFVKAWDHIHHLAQNAHLNWNDGGRIHWVLIVSWRTYLPMGIRTNWQKKAGWIGDYWPGASEVDIVSADGYDVDRCVASRTARKTVSPRYLFGYELAWARNHGGLPAFVSEFGGNNKGSVQPDFVRSMETFVANNHRIAAALYWSGRGRDTCNFTLTSTGISTLKAMGHSGALGGHIAG